jgi:predicted kinase
MSSPDAPAAAVLLLCGLPGCGKSTLAAALAHAVQDRGLAPVVLSVDDEEAAMLARGSGGGGGAAASAAEDASPAAWTEAAWHAARAAVLGRCVDALRDALRAGGDDDGGGRHAPPPPPNRRLTLVIVDDNHYYASMRRPFYAAARDARAGFGVLWLDAPLATALGRDAARAGRAAVGGEVIARMAARFEPPGGGGRGGDGDGTAVVAASESAGGGAAGRDDDRWLRLDATQPAADHLPAALAYVMGVLLTPAGVPPLPAPAPGLTGEALEAARAATAASAMHAADAGLRSCVGRVVAAVKAAQAGGAPLPHRDAAGTATLAAALASAVDPAIDAAAAAAAAALGPAQLEGDAVPAAPRWTTAAVAAAANDARRAALGAGVEAAAVASDTSALAALFARHLAAALAAAAH